MGERFSRFVFLSPFQKGGERGIYSKDEGKSSLALLRERRE
jgi:hypothetical protein